MRFEFENGSFAGSAEWTAPGRVTVEMEDPQQKRWFEDYFRGEDSYLAGPVECGEMHYGRRDESEAAFTRAAQMLAAYAYKVRRRDAERHGSYGGK